MWLDLPEAAMTLRATDETSGQVSQQVLCSGDQVGDPGAALQVNFGRRQELNISKREEL